MPDFRCIDMHSHTGALFLGEHADGALLGTMAEGNIHAVVWNVLSDRVVVPFGTAAKDGTQGGTFESDREPEPNECRRDVHAQLDQLDQWLARLAVRRILGPEDLSNEQPGVILAIEGGCQLEGDQGRLHELYERGLRSMQLVHYRVNELGDVQTSPPRHGGLTAAGRAVVTEMNRLGIIVDGTHATFDTMTGIAEASAAPVVLSHDCLQEDPPHPRFLDRDHARLIAATGGVIGVQAAAYDDRGPARGLAGLVDKIRRMADAIGIDHVGVGTDMGTATWPPSARAVFPDFKPFVALPAKLAQAGFDDGEVDQITSGNFIRVFRATAAAAAA